MHVHVYISLCDHASFDGDISAIKVQRTHLAFSQVPPELYPGRYPHREGTVLKREDSERTRETSHQSKHAIIHTPLVKMKREIDSIRVDRDMVHARRVNHTDFRGIGHPSLSLGCLHHRVVWGGVWCPLSRSQNRNGGSPP